MTTEGLCTARITDLLQREPFAAYREKSRRYLTSHQLADFRKCPALYQKKRLGLLPDEDRPAFLLGRAVHTWALEGKDVFEKTFAVGGPINSRTGKPFGVATQAYQEWVAAQGKPALSDEQFALVTNVVTAISAHSRALGLLCDGVPEGAIRTEYCGKESQIRIDWLNSNAGIVDLKTCDDLNWFEADAKRFGYVYQIAFYRAVLERHCGQRVSAHFIAVEKKEPYRCGVWEISDQTLDYCQRENEAAIERLKICESTGLWPTGYEETRVFDAI